MGCNELMLIEGKRVTPLAQRAGNEAISGGDGAGVAHCKSIKESIRHRIHIAE